MTFSALCLLARCLLGCLMMFARREVCKDAELLVLRHENAMLRRQISRVRYQPVGFRNPVMVLTCEVTVGRWAVMPLVRAR